MYKAQVRLNSGRRPPVRRTVRVGRRRRRPRSRERLVQLPQAAPLLPRLPQALRRLPQEAACARAVALERRRHHGQARRRRPLRRGGRRLEGGGRRPSVYMYYRLDGVDAWRPPGVPARDGLVLLLMMYSSSRLV